MLRREKTICLLLAFIAIVHSAPFLHKRYTIDRNSKYTPTRFPLVPRTMPKPTFVDPPTPDQFFNFIPTYMGSALQGNKLSWSSPCFSSNVATFNVLNGTAQLTISTSGKKSSSCSDGYLIGYVGSFDIAYLNFEGDHSIVFTGPWTKAQIFDIQNSGLRIFMFPNGITMTIDSVFETVMLFFGGLIGAHVPEWTAEDNIQFLKDHMGVTFEIRNITNVDIPQVQVHSGDFLGIIRMDGLDPMLAWGMGSHTGHTAITMWIDGILYVCESTVNSAYWPTNGIQKTPWEQWITQAQAASYNVIHLPLSPESISKFDVDKAIEFYNSVEGLPYGFHNLFTGWVDTAEDNYPPPLSSHLVQLLAPFAEWLLTQANLGQTYDFVTQGLNKRLGTSGLNIDEVYMEMAMRGMSFVDAITMPELDEWVFEDNNQTGPSMVCDVFVMRMWKAGGLFGEIADQIQAAEFTNWDAYSLNIFDANYVRPSQCVEADPDSPFCQLLGEYRMQLPQYNSFAPFPNMREKCPSLPPKYIKPANC